MDGFCRGCLIRYDEPAELLEYTEKNRRLFVYCTGIQVKRNDTFTFQLCKDCYLNMKQACKFKKLCRTSDKKFKTYMSLKEIGDAVDLCTYLKNNDDMLRFPTFAANSTPRNQKNKDGIDDLDESTCTSIGNFMTDILQGEEMPDTEARIIRQVIEEEADVLDDSLDSHWLQDDASIDTDFRLDFSFSPFSTPQSVMNDHCYTPSRLFTPNKLRDEIKHKYVEVPKMHVQKLKDHPPRNMPDLHKEPNKENNIIATNMEVQKQIGTDLEIEQIDTHLENALLDVHSEFNQETNLYENPLTQKLINTNLETKQVDNNLEENLVSHDKVNEELSMDIFGTDGIIATSHDNVEHNLIILRDDTVSDEQLNKVNNKNYYVDNLLLVESVNDDKLDDSFLVDNQKKIPTIQQYDPPVVIADSIDKNLQNALKGNSEKIALEDLLTSPAVVPSADVLSTPTIHNLLFGNVSDNKVNLEKNMYAEKSGAVVFGNKMESSGIFKESSDNFKNTKLGSVSSIEKILFGEKQDREEKQYQNSLILENKIDDAPDTTLDSIEKIIFGEKFDDSKTEEKMEIEGSYIEVLDEFFNSRDIKQASYSEKKTQDLIMNSGIRYDSKTCEELYDFEECYCKSCKIKFKTLKALRIHSAKIHKILLEKSKSKLSERVCDICGITIKDARNFTRHKEIHLESKDKVEYKCDECVLSFKQKHHLNKHKRIHNRAAKTPDTKKPQKKYICSECGLCVSSISALNIHQRKHNLDFVDSCTQCGKGFYTKHSLMVHMRKHTGEQPYKCPYCPKAFKRSNSLNKHILMHAVEKFQCDHCQRSFNQKKSIINHLSMNLCPMLRKRKKKMLEKYECQYCHAMVSGAGGLQAHQRLSRNCHIKRYNLEPIS